MTIDLLVTLLAQTIFHPVLAWLLPLLLYLNLLPSPSPSASHIRLAFLYAVAISLARLLLRLDARLARGTPRRLDWANEVVVITGGLGGLGRLVAKAYGERGVTVAVLDIKEEGGAETREILRLGGKVKYFRCDVGQRGEVEAVRQRIEEDVRRRDFRTMYRVFSAERETVGVVGHSDHSREQRGSRQRQNIP